MNVVFVTLLATLFIQLGYFLWKISSTELSKFAEASLFKVIQGYFSNVKWTAGLVATIVGWVLFVHATEIGAISFVQPLMSVGDVFLIGLAIFFLKERLSKKEWIGLIMIVIGASALSAEAGTSVATETQWQRVLLLLSISITLFLILFFMAKRNVNSELNYALIVGIGFGTGSILTKLLTNSISLSPETTSSLWSYLFHPLIPFVVISNFTGLILLQIAFQKGRASVIVPVQLSVVNVMAVVGGSYLFNETISNYRISCIILITLGTTLLKTSFKSEGLIQKSNGVSLRFTKTIFILIALTILPLAFNQCTKGESDNLQSSNSLTSISKSKARGGGGDGVGFGGKPGDTYFRRSPNFGCDGKLQEIASIQFLQSSLIYQENDPYKCNFTNTSLSSSEIEPSLYDETLFGYREGIFQKLPPNVTLNDAPYTEVWCSNPEATDALELVTTFNPRTSAADTMIYFKSAEQNIHYVPSFQVSRLAIDRKISVQAESFNLEVNEDQLFNNEFGKYKGKLTAKIDNQLIEQTLSCRLGGQFDPLVWPAKTLSKIEVIGKVQSSSVADSKLKTYGFFSPAIHDPNSNNRKEIYLFNENNRLPQRLAFTGQEYSLGYEHIMFSPDGRFLYYRSDSEVSHQFHLYRQEIKTGHIKKISKSPISGAGLLATLNGGYRVYSDGTLIFIESSLTGAGSLFYIDGSSSDRAAKAIDQAFVGGQTAGFAYSTSEKKIFFAEFAGSSNSNMVVTISFLKIDSGEIKNIASLTGENLFSFSFATTYPEVKDFLTLTRTDSVDSIKTSKVVLINTKNALQKEFDLTNSSLKFQTLINLSF